MPILSIMFLFPFTGSPPTFSTEPSTYAKDFEKALKDVTNADIVFTFENGSESIPAHKIVLWLNPSAFQEALCQKDVYTFKKFKDIFDMKEMSGDSFQSGKNKNLKTSPQKVTCVILKNWISQETFIEILEFLYTGEAGISMESEYDKIKKLLSAAEKLKVCVLVDICNHLLKLKDNEKKTDSSKKKPTGLAPKPPRPSVRDLFIAKKATPFSDVTFLVEDKLVFAHKVVLTARSPVLAAHVSENFRDGKSPQVDFILKYACTIHNRQADRQTDRLIVKYKIHQSYHLYLAMVGLNSLVIEMLVFDTGEIQNNPEKKKTQSKNENQQH